MKRSILYYILLSFGIITLTSCNSEKKKEVPQEEIPTEAIGDNSMTSLDWDGTYEGTLPCADCKGIKTIVTLNKDNTYVAKEVYQGRDSLPVETKGTFEWDKAGQTISFSDKDRHSYFVGENTLTHLDKDGNKVTGNLKDTYILNKVQDELVGKKWHLVSFRNDDIQLTQAKAEHPYIQFQEDFTIVGYTGCNNLQGGYELKDAQKIEFSNLINTLKSCPEIKTENEFLKIINATDAYAFKDHDLILYDKNHKELAEFKVAN